MAERGQAGWDSAQMAEPGDTDSARWATEPGDTDGVMWAVELGEADGVAWTCEPGEADGVMRTVELGGAIERGGAMQMAELGAAGGDSTLFVGLDEACGDPTRFAWSGGAGESSVG